MIAVLASTNHELKVLFQTHSAYEGYGKYRYYYPGSEPQLLGWWFTGVEVYGTLLETHHGWHLFETAMSRVKHS